jgi:hypothetical protein
MIEIAEQGATMAVTLPRVAKPAGLIAAGIQRVWEESELAASALPEGFVFAAWNPTTGELLELDSGSWVKSKES